MSSTGDPGAPSLIGRRQPELSKRRVVARIECGRNAAMPPTARRTTVGAFRIALSTGQRTIDVVWSGPVLERSEDNVAQRSATNLRSERVDH